MKRGFLTLAFLCICPLLVVAPPLQAQWIEDGVGVCTETNVQDDLAIIADGAGGAYIAWEDLRSGGASDIYMQRVDARGNPLWTAGGVAICTATGYQNVVRIVSDESGGAIVSWLDRRAASNDVYAQRVDENGTTLWTADGVAVCNESHDQYDPVMTADGTGGAVIAWRDYRPGNIDIYAQRIDSNGNALWAANGVTVCTDPTTQDYMQITSSGPGEAIVVWADARGGDFDIYVQRLYSTGATAWTYNGYPVCTASAHQLLPQIVPDPSFGAIVVWQDARGASTDIYAQRVSIAGYATWTADGVAICTATDNQYDPMLTADGGGGAFITWEDNRSGTDWDVYAAHIDIGGTLHWTANGIVVSAAYYNQDDPKITFDGDGGCVITWEDARRGTNDVFAQRLDGDGNAHWTANGAPVCLAAYTQYTPQIASDGVGGAMIAWEDTRVAGDYNIYAQRIERNGYWGYPAPSITGTRDVPGDEGGFVNVAWDASRLDPWPEELIYYYTVWRAIDESEALALTRGGASMIRDYAPGLPRESVRMERLGSETYYWKMISTLYAHGLGAYSEIVPTVFDSTAVCAEYHYFQVIAHTSDWSKEWISAPDSGYSVDNLVPCPPICLAGEQSYNPEGLELTWTPNEELDLDFYTIYRATDPGFTPGPDNLLASQCDTLYFDGEWTWDGGYCYKVAAVDIHGNESEYTLLCSENITGDETPVKPPVTYLEQNYPNPFNPSTSIAFGLNGPGQVSLRIYDATGRLVRTLVEESREAGVYHEIWDGRDNGGRAIASGIYFYRLITGDFVQTKKMLLLR